MGKLRQVDQWLDIYMHLCPPPTENHQWHSGNVTKYSRHCSELYIYIYMSVSINLLSYLSIIYLPISFYLYLSIPKHTHIDTHIRKDKKSVLSSCLQGHILEMIKNEDKHRLTACTLIIPRKRKLQQWDSENHRKLNRELLQWM